MNLLTDRMRWLRSVALAFAALASPAALAAADATPASAAPGQRGGQQLLQANKPSTGDFDAMLDRRIIRFLVPYSRSLYFVDKGRERGISAELARDFEQYVNRKYAKHSASGRSRCFLS